MLPRLLHIRLDVKLLSRRTNILFSIPINRQSCNQCGSRLFSSHKVVNYFDKSPYNRNRLLWNKLRYYSSQVDAEKKSETLDIVKEKSTLDSSKKINVKLKKSELKRLITLAEPEKWTLAGKTS
jgi:hypothetical protein